MQVHLDFEKRVARVVAASSVGAGWMGFEFARNNQDLTEDGWKIYFYNDAGALPGYIGLPIEHDVRGAVSLAQAIRAGAPESCCHNCCCRRRVT